MFRSSVRLLFVLGVIACLSVGCRRQNMEVKFNPIPDGTPMPTAVGGPNPQGGGPAPQVDGGGTPNPQGGGPAPRVGDGAAPTGSVRPPVAKPVGER